MFSKLIVPVLKKLIYCYDLIFNSVIGIDCMILRIDLGIEIPSEEWGTAETRPSWRDWLLGKAAGILINLLLELRVYAQQLSRPPLLGRY